MSKMTSEEEEAVQAEFALLEKEARGEVSIYPSSRIAIIADEDRLTSDGGRRCPETADRGAIARCSFNATAGGYGRGLRERSPQAEGSTARAGSFDHRHAELRLSGSSVFSMPRHTSTFRRVVYTYQKDSQM